MQRLIHTPCGGRLRRAVPARAMVNPNGIMSQSPGLRRIATLPWALGTAFLGGVSKQLDCPPVIVGGVADHVPLLARCGRGITQSDWVKCGIEARHPGRKPDGLECTTDERRMALRVIESFGDKQTEKLWQGKRTRFPAEKAIPASTPGRILDEEFLKGFGLFQAETPFQMECGIAL